MEAQLEIYSYAGVNYILNSDFNWNDIQNFRVQVTQLNYLVSLRSFGRTVNKVK